MDIANALEANVKLIRTENEVDVAVAQQAGYEKPLISRLTLKAGKARDCINLLFLFWHKYISNCLVPFYGRYLALQIQFVHLQIWRTQYPRFWKELRSEFLPINLYNFLLIIFLAVDITVIFQELQLQFWFSACILMLSYFL